MIYYSPCKINIGLRILNKREDGYHNLETIFYPIPLYDILEVIPQEAFQFVQTGVAIYAKPEENLCVKAYHLFKKHYPATKEFSIHLHKMIPTGAGLGGGSANAAFVLRALNDQSDNVASINSLKQMALELGSDCPFFIEDKPCLGKGRGEQLTPISLALHGYHICLINPGIHIKTPWAFSEVKKYAERNYDIASILYSPIEHWKEICFNDFEPPVFDKHPEIRTIKQTLYNNGALYASMSGSGSTMFGLFKNTPPAIKFPDNYLVIYKELL